MSHDFVIYLTESVNFVYFSLGISKFVHNQQKIIGDKWKTIFRSLYSACVLYFVCDTFMNSVCICIWALD